MIRGRVNEVNKFHNITDLVLNDEENFKLPMKSVFFFYNYFYLNKTTPQRRGCAYYFCTCKYSNLWDTATNTIETARLRGQTRKRRQTDRGLFLS